MQNLVVVAKEESDMALALVIIGIIAGAIYNAVSDNGFNKEAGWRFIIGFCLVGCVLEAIFGHTVGFIFIVILFAGWLFH